MYSLDYNPNPDHEKPKPINDNYYLYTVKLADLFDILENKKPLAGWKPKKEIHQKYNPASNKNRFRNS